MAASPTHLTTAPTSGTTTYMETAFEDWIEQRQMDYNQQPTEFPAEELAIGVAAENGIGEDDIRWETVEGEAELRVELNDSEETLDDGTTVRRQTITRHCVCPVSDVLIINGVSTEHRRATDRLLDISIEEDVLVLPPGVEDSDLSDDLRTTTDVEELEESLDDGTPIRRRITTTTIIPAVDDLPPSSEASEMLSLSTGLEFEPSAEPLDVEEQFDHLNRPTTDVDIGRYEQTTDLESTGGFLEPAEISTGLEFEPSAEPLDVEEQFELNRPTTDVDIGRYEQTTDLESTGGFPEPAEISTGLEFEPSAEPLDVEEQFDDLNRPTTDVNIGRYEQTTDLESTDGFPEATETITGVDQPAELYNLPDSEFELEKQAEQVVAQSIAASLQEVRSTSPGRCCTHSATHMLHCDWSMMSRFNLLYG